MRRALSIILALLLLMSLIGCGGSKVIIPDYLDAASFEEALNRGEDLTGKTVQFVVNEMVPNSAFGYNLQAGEHLNFCSKNHPKATSGDTVVVEVEEISSMRGSYVISYKMIQITPASNPKPSPNEEKTAASIEPSTTYIQAKTEEADIQPKEETKHPITEDGIVSHLKSQIETFSDFTSYNEGTDPNGILGQPGQYYAKTDFWDSRLAAAKLDEYSGTFELFNTIDDCEERYQDLLSVLYPAGSIKQHLIQWDTVLFRVSDSFTNGQVREYLDNMINYMGEPPKATSFIYSDIADAVLDSGSKEDQRFYTVEQPVYYSQSIGGIDYQIPAYLTLSGENENNNEFGLYNSDLFVYLHIAHAPCFISRDEFDEFLSSVEDELISSVEEVDDSSLILNTIDSFGEYPYVVYSGSSKLDSIPVLLKFAFLFGGGTEGELYTITMIRSIDPKFNEIDPLDGFERMLETVSRTEGGDKASNAETAYVDGIRPEFKAAMDSHEAFFDEYIEFMASFDTQTATTETFLRYLQLVAQYTETMSAMEAWKSNEMTDEETAYYLEVMTRINQKLLAAANNG